MKSTLKLGFTLAAFAAISCTVLAVVNNFTGPVIAAHAAEKSNAGLAIVFPEATKFTIVEDVTKGSEDAKALSEYISSNLINLNSVYIAYKDDTVIGTVVQVDGPSYDHVTLMIGLDMSRTLTGMNILETTDSPGFGIKALEPEFYGQFTGLDASKTLVSGTDFDAISGATITSKAYATLVNFAVYVGGEYLANNYGGASGSAAPTGPVTYEDPYTFGQAMFEIFDIPNNENLKAEAIEVPESVNGFNCGDAFSIININTKKAIGAIVSIKGMSNNHEATVIAGVDLNRTILGARIMRLDDAPGFGLAAINKSFYSQFTGKSVDTYFGPGAGITALENAENTSESISQLIQAAGWTASEWLAKNADGKKASAKAAPFTKTITEGTTFTTSEAIFDIYGIDLHPELVTKSIENLPVLSEDTLDYETYNEDGLILSEKTPEVEQGFFIYDGDTLKATVFEISGMLYAREGSVTVAINTDGIIDGVRITNINDTPMIGNKTLGETFWKQFTGKAANGKLSVPDNIDAVTGATVTSTRITNLVNSAATAYALNSEN